MNTKEMAARVYELSQKQRELEKELKELKEGLKAKGSGKYGDYVVSVEDRARESFQLKEAKKSLTEAVWKKIAGFVKETSYQQVKVVKA